MAEESKGVFRVNGKDYPMPTNFTLGEMCDAEQFFGVEFGPDQKRSARVVAATVWIAIRRVDASVTVDDIRNLDPEDIEEIDGDDDPLESPPQSSDESGGSNETSGSDSESDGADQGSHPNGSGTLDSPTHVISDPVT